MEELITTKEAAVILGIKPQSLRVRLVRGMPPFPVNRPGPGIRTLWRISDIMKLKVDREK